MINTDPIAKKEIFTQTLNYFNVTMVASEIARRVPDMAIDSPINRESLIQGLLKQELDRCAKLHLEKQAQPHPLMQWPPQHKPQDPSLPSKLIQDMQRQAEAEEKIALKREPAWKLYTCINCGKSFIDSTANPFGSLRCPLCAKKSDLRNPVIGRACSRCGRQFAALSEGVTMCGRCVQEVS